MLKIRMQRTGRTNDPSFRIVVTEHTRGPRSANFLEKLGTYNPKTKVRTLDAERVKHWLSVGAKASGTMYNMLIAAGVIEGKKVNVLPQKSPPKKEEQKEKIATEAAPEVSAYAEETTPAEAAPEAAPETKDEPKDEKAPAPAEEEKKEGAPAESVAGQKA